MLYVLDSQMYVWRVHCTKLEILSLQWRMQCLSSSSLGALNFLSTCLWNECCRMLASCRSASSDRTSDDYAPCVVNLGEHGIAKQQAGNLQDLIDGGIRGWQPLSASAARIGPFIPCRSGWHLVCNISAGYVTFWTCEWRAWRHIVSGWHAASMADMEHVFGATYWTSLAQHCLR